MKNPSNFLGADQPSNLSSYFNNSLNYCGTALGIVSGHFDERSFDKKYNLAIKI